MKSADNYFDKHRGAAVANPVDQPGVMIRLHGLCRFALGL
ncbi:hypothetical protein SAMN04488238_1493 [Roseicitreum antarcticum]|uniref:Uncharacterized protein n=1 Tax=Roseicitreum antarcticum TaxID=564137 RepID=A0A1H3FTF7_9RHOB|nr:hypothetical protein SAMN04488238_1493 [Roseicitreum antarcticum]